MSLSTIFVAVVPLFLIASCRPLQQTPQELQARQTLRAMTRGGVMPSEDAVAKIEKDFPNTTAGSLAKLVHARLKLNAKDFAGVASLLDSSAIAQYTVIGDYALWMKANALEQAGRSVEARAAYEKLARDFPTSLHAREAVVHDAQMLMQSGQAAAVPAILDSLRRKDPSEEAILVNTVEPAIEL
ncbi:MAG TPA: tetratricopeptide repeat protein, partial [Pyrinomonadaceae bacterium]|nr:tetratricopeptide repeat protein [Pyrinomonadaceae bacterium]